MNDQTQLEVDMGTVQKVFAYASDTIVEASKLRQDFSQLRVEVDGLREELTRLRRQNEFMDEQLVNIRRSRDEAHGKIHELEGTLHQRNEYIVNLERSHDSDLATINTRTQQLMETSKERDDAQLRVMELEEANAKLSETLASVQGKLAELSNLFAPTPTSPAGGALRGDIAEVESFDEAERRPGESEEEHRQRTQPRDPVTQQWRSPYEEQGVAAKSGDDMPF